MRHVVVSGHRFISLHEVINTTMTYLWPILDGIRKSINSIPHFQKGLVVIMGSSVTSGDHDLEVKIW
jgi:hypothetical protein